MPDQHEIKTFETRLAALLKAPRLVDGQDRVSINSGHLWQYQRRKEYEQRFGPVHAWVLALHVHLRNDICRVALECGQPLPQRYELCE